MEVAYSTYAESLLPVQNPLSGLSATMTGEANLLHAIVTLGSFQA